MTAIDKNSNLQSQALPFECVHQIFENQCSQFKHTNIRTEETVITYNDLNLRSNSVANQLLWSGIEPEQIVAVLMDRSLEALYAQLGVLKSGAAYLPLSPDDFPIARIKFIFEDASVNHVVTLAKHRELIEQVQTQLGRRITCFYIDEVEEDARDNGNDTLIKEISCSPLNLAYVMYTSGSTGTPKGVLITHGNIVSSVTSTNYFSFKQSDAMLHAAPISFDAATFEIWGSLLNGLPLCVVSNQTVRNFNALSDFVSEHNIKIAWLTSALCNLIADSDLSFFSKLSLLLVGGEALSPNHINKIRQAHPNLTIRNNYGPTENTIFSTSFLIDRNYDLNIPIGHAVSHKRAYVLDEQMRPTLPHQTGQLYVGGAGVARGYLNRPEDNANKFVCDPFVKNERLYATGDLCRYNQEGEIEYIGRNDTQVKIMGHRIELGEIETALHTCPGVEQAIVMYRHLSETNKGIVAFVTLNNTTPAKIRAQLDTCLPSYMVPNYFSVLDNFPITVNGKVNRHELSLQPLQIKTDQSSIASIPSQIRDQVISLVKVCLELDTIETTESFFELGGDSLSGTCLMVELSRLLNKELPLQILYANPVIDDLVEMIIKGDIVNNNRVSSERLINDSLLPDYLKKSQWSAKLKQLHNDKSNKLFITGVTGFLGAFLLKELLQTKDTSCFCLVRSENTQHGTQRILDTFEKYQIPISIAEKSRIFAIPGDLDKPSFGLRASQFGELSTLIGEIFHCGAAVNYVDTYDKLKPTNVEGSKEILRLSCMNQLIPIHYISSVSVFETIGFFTGKRMIFENESVDATANLVKLGYSQSKWAAEKLMENAQNEGLPVNIYRTGYVMGHSETGVSNTTDHIARYIAGCIEMRCAPVLDEYASLAPVDQLTKALKHIAIDVKPNGKTFHLCNPEFTTVSEIYQNIKNFGFDLELVPYNEWKHRFENTSTDNPLYPLLSLHIHSAPDHLLTLPELYERNARFDCTELLKALDGSGINLNLSDHKIFERWLLNYVEQGLIQSSTFQRAYNNQAQTTTLEVAC